MLPIVLRVQYTQGHADWCFLRTVEIFCPKKPITIRVPIKERKSLFRERISCASAGSAHQSSLVPGFTNIKAGPNRSCIAYLSRKPHP